MHNYNGHCYIKMTMALCKYLYHQDGQTVQRWGHTELMQHGPHARYNYTKFSLYNAENTCYISRLHNSRTARCTNFCRARSNLEREHAFITAIHTRHLVRRQDCFTTLTMFILYLMKLMVILILAKNSFLFIHDPFLSIVWTSFLMNIRPN